MRDTGSASAAVPARICLAGESLDWMIGGPSVVAAIGLRTEVTATVNHRSRLVRLTAGEPINAQRTVATQRLDQLAAVIGAVDSLPVRHLVLDDTDSRGVECTLLA